MNRVLCELTLAIKLTKHSLNEHSISKAFENFNEKLQIQNAVLFYQLASKFNLPDIHLTVFRYMERCFSIIVETESFLELDFNAISKIIASSSLQIDSEVEVYNAANLWLNHNLKERSKYAKQLLLKVRLNLLSDHCVKYLISFSSCISKNNECLEVLTYRHCFYQNMSAIYNKSRHCNQNMFNILLFGGYSRKGILKQVKEFGPVDFSLKLPPMLEKRYYSKAVCLKGEAYIFGGLNKDGRVKLVEKYSPVFKKWFKVTDIPDDRQHFCACAFVDKIYLFSGHDDEPGCLNSCFQLDVKLLKWKKGAKMNETRSQAACAIFEENIVVSGGCYHANTVESYDVFDDTWTPMPNMIEGRTNHSLVCVKNKLFAIGGGARLNTDCEVFDKTSNMFVTLKTPNFLSKNVKSLMVGSKVFVFQFNTKIVLCYDIDKNEWLKKCCEATENLSCYSYVKVPLY